MFSLSGPNTRALLKQTNKKLSVPHLPSPTGLPCTRQKPHTLLSQSFLRSWSETPSGWPTYFLQMRLREWNRQLCAKSAAAPLTARLCPDALKHSPSLPHVQVCETEREGGGQHREKHVRERGGAASGHGRNGPQLSSPRPLTLSPLEPAHGPQLAPQLCFRGAPASSSLPAQTLALTAAERNSNQQHGSAYPVVWCKHT